MIGWKWIGLFSGLFVVALCAAGAAQSEAPEVFTPPRVVAAVYSAGGPVDRVMLLFDREVPRQGVRERIARLSEICNSKVWNLDIRYKPFVSLWQSDADRAAGNAESKPVTQTMVRFGMTGLTDWKRGSLAVAPFAQAFRRDLPVRVVYNVGAEFPFREPAQSEFLMDGIRIEHFASPTSHQYDVTLAAAAPVAVPPAPETSGAAAVRRWTAVFTGLAIAIVVTLIVLVGLIAYEVRTHPRRGAGRPASQETEGFAQERPSPDPSQGQGESETQRG